MQQDQLKKLCDCINKLYKDKIEGIYVFSDINKKDPKGLAYIDIDCGGVKAKIQMTFKSESVIAISYNKRVGNVSETQQFEGPQMVIFEKIVMILDQFVPSELNAEIIKGAIKEKLDDPKFNWKLFKHSDLFESELLVMPSKKNAIFSNLIEIKIGDGSVEVCPFSEEGEVVELNTQKQLQIFIENDFANILKLAK